MFFDNIYDIWTIITCCWKVMIPNKPKVFINYHVKKVVKFVTRISFVMKMYNLSYTVLQHVLLFFSNSIQYNYNLIKDNLCSIIWISHSKLPDRLYSKTTKWNFWTCALGEKKQDKFALNTFLCSFFVLLWFY